MTLFLVAAGTQENQAGWQAAERAERKGSETVVLRHFIREDDGQGLVEYALIIAVIAIAVIVAMIFLRGQLQYQFSNIGNNLT